MAELYTYDQGRQPRNAGRLQGQATTYNHRLDNRLISKNRQTQVWVNPSPSYSYTPAGDRAAMPARTVQLSTRTMPDTTSLTKATPQAAVYTYDAAGNLASMRSSNLDGVSVNLQLRRVNRLESVVDNRLAAGTTTYSYDGVGNVLESTAANGVSRLTVTTPSTG